MAELKIEYLGLHGDGVADGPIYAPLTLPGEVVSGTVEGTALRDVRIVQPSDRRVRPPCCHFKTCGGCQLQHADDDFVAAWKIEIVQRALSAHDLRTEFRPIQTSPPQTRRRAGFAARRTKKGALSGFFGRGSDTVVAIPHCILLDPAVLAGSSVAEALALAGASRKATLSVMITETKTGLDVAVSGGKPLDGPLRLQLAGLCEQSGLARLSWDGEVIAMRCAPVQAFDGIDVSPPPGAFLQATTHGEATLLSAVKEITSGTDKIVDLFAGCGTFALPLSRHAEVLAVENDEDMIHALDRAWRAASGLKAVTTETRDLFRRPLLADEFRGVDAVVIDPPRAGADAQIAELKQTNVVRIAYVSCHPTSFARDARQLVNAGFTLDWIQVVDQFRWSAHVELVASFTSPHMRR
ncbi:RsmD family RNA methyltransferase [uncultured Roseobacter sp.]|uniref:class I SAM-dependent RNA methyltransferase n=1 Tax=uncultured Roseobacter sp. TaxID=114847 RepID=UPI002635D050|nr:RsmD family RNA methyltransferase [uncultured Roseobacter sp.]